MKLCIITNFYYPNIIGGAEIIARNIATGMAEKGIETVVITTSNKCKIEKRYEGNIKIISFFPLNIYWLYNSKKRNIINKLIWHIIDVWNPYSYFRLKKILKKEKPDIVHTHNIDGFSYSVWTAVKSLKIPLVHTMHDYHLICPRNTLLKGNMEICEESKFICKIYSKIGEKISRNIDFVTAPSESLMNYMLSTGFFQNKKNRVIYNGLKANKDKTTKVKESIKTKNRKSVRNILFIGNLEENKGISVLSKVIRRNADINLHFFIAGKGSQENKMKKELEKIKNVTFLGFVKDNEKEEIFQQSDILFFPSLGLENCPTVILEAYKYGLPVVASEIGGVKELVQHGKTGFLFSPGNDEKAYQYIYQLSKNQQTYTEMNKNALVRFENFTLEKQINSYLEIYNEVQ